MLRMSAAEDEGTAQEGPEKMTLLSEIAASLIKARRGMKDKFESLPDRRKRYVLGRGLVHFAHLIEVQYEEHCQRTKQGRRKP